LDESGAKTNLTRLRGRALRGQRVHAKSPHGHWRTTTLLCAMRVDGSTACMAVEGATDTEVFRAYVERVLCPTVRTGDMVVMDNLWPHKNQFTLSDERLSWRWVGLVRRCPFVLLNSNLSQFAVDLAPRIM
jgi:hypothetical protein